jgi:hypothetical protein
MYGMAVSKCLLKQPRTPSQDLVSRRRSRALTSGGNTIRAAGEPVTRCEFRMSLRVVMARTEEADRHVGTTIRVSVPA